MKTLYRSQFVDENSWLFRNLINYEFTLNKLELQIIEVYWSLFNKKF